MIQDRVESMIARYAMRLIVLLYEYGSIGVMVVDGVV